MTHTPGPWKVFFDAGIIEVTANDEIPVVNWQGFDDSNRPFGVHVENAKLIASAPELYAEVERLRKELEGKRQLHQLTNDELADATTENVRLTAQVDWLKSRLDKAVLMMVTPEFAKVRAEIKRLHEGQRWIPVDEKLPDEDIKVLVAVDENIQICFRSCGWWWTVADVDAHSVNATHWMPLPKPPVMEKGHE